MELGWFPPKNQGPKVKQGILLLIVRELHLRTDAHLDALPWLMTGFLVTCFNETFSSKSLSLWPADVTKLAFFICNGFPAASFTYLFWGLLSSVSTSAGKNACSVGLKMEIDLTSLKPSTSLPDELCFCLLWINILQNDQWFPNQVGCIFL